MQVNAGQRVTAALFSAATGLWVMKGSDEPWSNTTLHADGALVLPVLANTAYRFACYLDYEGATRGNGDLKWMWSVPALAKLRYQPIDSDILGGSSTGLTVTDSTVVAAGTSGSNNLRGATMKGSLLTGANAGNLQLMWAENTANSGTPTIIHAQSTLELIQ